MKIYKSSYDQTFKNYDNVYYNEHKINHKSALAIKKNNMSHTPFAWQEEDVVHDIPVMPSYPDWELMMDRNNPRPADPPAFQLKHQRFLAAYHEKLRRTRAEKRAQYISAKGSISSDFVLSRNTSSVEFTTDASGKKRVSRKAQTPDWTLLDAEKSKGDNRNKKPDKKKKVFIKEDRKKQRNTARSKYIVSKADPPLDMHPFTPFGTGNHNILTAKKMTANVRSPSNVYNTALRAAEASRRKKQNGDIDDPRNKLEYSPWKPMGRRNLWETENCSNFTCPNQRKMLAERAMAQQVMERAKKKNGMSRKHK